MPEGYKEKAIELLSTQTPRVLIAVATIAPIAVMSWFGKSTDVTTVSIAFVGCFALLMNYLIVIKTGKEEVK